MQENTQKVVSRHESVNLQTHQSDLKWLHREGHEALAFVGNRLQRLRVLAREKVPFNWRIGVRRFPALIVDKVRPELRRDAVDQRHWPHMLVDRSTPLRRAKTLYDDTTQLSKEQNVRLAASLVNGAVIAPGATFSWRRFVGPPLAKRGFVLGPELHDGVMSLGIGGGVCQVANLVFYLGVHAGMEVVERHRHDLDLFPDDGRDVPFGCGATVFYPHRDLGLRNTLDVALLVLIKVDAGFLSGEIRIPNRIDMRWNIVERSSRFFLQKGVTWRENRIDRLCIHQNGKSEASLLLKNRARVQYAVPPRLLEATTGG